METVSTQAIGTLTNKLLATNLVKQVLEKESAQLSQRDADFRATLVAFFKGKASQVRVSIQAGRSYSWQIPVEITGKNRARIPHRVISLHPDFHPKLYPEAVELANWSLRYQTKYSQLMTFFGFISAAPQDFLATISMLPREVQETIRGFAIPKQENVPLPEGHAECIDLIHAQTALDILEIW